MSWNITSTTRSLMDRDTLVACAAALSVLLICLRYFRYRGYWAKRNMKGEDPLPLFNDFYNLVLRNRNESAKSRREKFGKLYGVFINGMPRYVVADPEVMQQICTKDFNIFRDHLMPPWANKYQQSFLVWLKGDHWKRVRSMMTPAFSSGKIRRMFRCLERCADDLVVLIGEQIDRNGAEGVILNAKDTFGMMTMDSISTCGYGLRLQRRNDATNIRAVASRSDYIKALLLMLESSSLRLIVLSALPKWLLDLLGLEASPMSRFQPITERMEKWIAERRASGVKKEDLLQSLIDARLDQLSTEDLGSKLDDSSKMDRRNVAAMNDSHTGKIRLDDMEIMTEAIFLLLAGFETTSTLMTLCTYSLAHHQDIQQHLYEKIRSMLDKQDGKAGFVYDELIADDYLDAIICESLRMMAPFPFTDRVAEQDYFVEKYNMTIPRGASVMLAIATIQNDPDYWQEPERFRPERFLPGEREKIKSGTYVPFSAGPRFCIGMRFALAVSKISLAKTILNYKVDPAPGTPFPPELGRVPLMISFKNPFVRFSRRP